MTDNIKTLCKITGPEESLVEFKKFVFIEDRDFDFERIVPVPSCFDGRYSVANSPKYVLAVLLRGPGSGPSWDWLQGLRPEIGGWAEAFTLEKSKLNDVIENVFPGSIADARAIARCFAETGFFDVTDWAYANWGTKWNALNFQIHEEKAGLVWFSFETANYFPRPIFETLAARFPTLSIACFFTDEDGGEAAWPSPR